MNPEIFREYDIRGIADQDLNDEVVVTLGINCRMAEAGCFQPSISL